MLRVVQPAHGEPRVDRVRVGHDRLHVVRDQHLEQPPKNAHAASHPAITASSVCENVSHTNMCREYTAVKINACATRRRPVAGSWTRPIRPKSIWHSTPGSPSATRTVAAAAEPAALHTEPVQRAVRHHHALTGQQVADLHHRQVPPDPLRDLLLLRLQQLPRRPVPGRPDRPHRRHHRADHLVGELARTAARGPPRPPPPPARTAGRSYDPHPPERPPYATRAGQPGPQHFTYLDH